MGFKSILKLVVFLGLLFLVLYIGVNNRQSAVFNFPIMGPKTETDAWEIYFGMFAIGVVAGAVLLAGGGRGKGPSKGEK